jgi:ABC-type branched-subunit amino acid transport system ATPase component
MALIPGITAGGAAIILAEQFTTRVLSICDVVVVLQKGRVALTVPNPQSVDLEAMRRATLGL